MYFLLKQYDLTISGGNEIFLTVSKCLKGDYKPEQISNLSFKKKGSLLRSYRTYFLQAITSMKNNRRQQNVEENFWVKCYLKNKI